MRPLTANTPKPMLKVAGKPLLHHLWEALPKEINEVILVVGYLSDQIKEYFGDEFMGRKVDYIYQDKNGVSFKDSIREVYFEEKVSYQEYSIKWKNTNTKHVNKVRYAFRGYIALIFLKLVIQKWQLLILK